MPPRGQLQQKLQTKTANTRGTYINTKQHKRQELTAQQGERRDACKAYLCQLVEDGLDIHPKGEWRALASSANRRLNSTDMD